jgi:hypothetical protein
MKKFTHAWLAFMAIKRLEHVDISDAKKAEDAKSLVRWFRNYRDYVIDGSWYPYLVFKDMATSHIIKYRPADQEGEQPFRSLPKTLLMYEQGKKSHLYKKPFTIEGGNLADRCEAIAHDIVDNLKMLRTEEKGCPISPTNNHIAMRFFILSHYIADAHMPLHCDSRSFSSGDDIHGYIEKQWDTMIRKAYEIDTANNRFLYDPEGYPLKKKPSQLIMDIEDEIVKREYQHTWGTKNSNTWDYMSAISQFSYLKSYLMIPEGYDGENMDSATFRTLEGGKNFEKYSFEILSDAVDSIARIWLHIWARYRDWAK